MVLNNILKFMYDNVILPQTLSADTYDCHNAKIHNKEITLKNMLEFVFHFCCTL